MTDPTDPRPEIIPVTVSLYDPPVDPPTEPEPTQPVYRWRDHWYYHVGHVFDHEYLEDRNRYPLTPVEVAVLIIVLLIVVLGGLANA